MRADIQLRQEAAADDAAGDEHAIADGEFSKQEAAAEQFCFDAARAVIEDDGHQRESAPAFVEVHDTADDDRLAVALAQVRDRDRRAPIAVCARDVREQLVGRGDAEFRELGRSLRTDARQRAEADCAQVAGAARRDSSAPTASSAIPRSCSSTTRWYKRSAVSHTS
jgi:hypothetical protein